MLHVYFRCISNHLRENFSSVQSFRERGTSMEFVERNDSNLLDAVKCSRMNSITSSFWQGLFSEQLHYEIEAGYQPGRSTQAVIFEIFSKFTLVSFCCYYYLRCYRHLSVCEWTTIRWQNYNVTHFFRLWCRFQRSKCTSYNHSFRTCFSDEKMSSKRTMWKCCLNYSNHDMRKTNMSTRIVWVRKSSVSNDIFIWTFDMFPSYLPKKTANHNVMRKMFAEKSLET